MATHRESLISSEIVYEGKVVTLRIDTVRLENGRECTREVVAHAGAVAIVPFLDDDTIVMVRQYRRAVDQVLLELPAGTLEPGEDPVDCARRELEEETGYRAGTITRLFGQYLAPGYSSERLTVYEARDLTPGRAHPDDDERVEVVRVPAREMYRKVFSGEIEDAKTIAGLLMVLSAVKE
jgi:ADP-ribose pyrophosphatase